MTFRRPFVLLALLASQACFVFGQPVGPPEITDLDVASDVSPDRTEEGGADSPVGDAGPDLDSSQDRPDESNDSADATDSTDLTDAPNCSDTCGSCPLGCCTQLCGSANADCDLSCESGCDCEYDCRSANSCAIRCSGDTTCDVDCSLANDCSGILCTGNAACLVRCDGASLCEFEQCSGGGASSCPGDVIVCHRACP